MNRDHAKRLRKQRVTARHQERDMGGVMVTISRRGNKERAILAFDEAHQADEPKLEGVWGERRECMTRNIRTCRQRRRVQLD